MPGPTTTAMPALSAGTRSLLTLVRQHEHLTRADIGEVTGWARVTVNARVDELHSAGLLREAGAPSRTGGRPATRFELDPTPGCLLVADVGATGAVLACCDLGGTVLDTRTIELAIGDGPDAVLSELLPALAQVHAPQAAVPVWGLGIGLPGPVEHPSGRVVSPPIMTGWNGFSIAERLTQEYTCPVVVENDADAMAWGEWRHTLATPGRTPRPRDGNLLFVKVGTGVGAGIVANGALLRGADGAAGDLGHTYVEPSLGTRGQSSPPPSCRCGNSGCVEAYASGWAIVRDLAAQGIHVGSVREVPALLAAGDPVARRLVRDAGRVLGTALASAVSLLNPAEVVLGGQFDQVDQEFLAGIRERITARSLPLATSGLVIRTSALQGMAGVVGLTDAVAREVLG